WTTSAQDSLPPQHKQSRSPLSSGVPEPDLTRRGGGEDAGLGRAPGSYHSRRVHHCVVADLLSFIWWVCVGRAVRAQTHPLSRSRERKR
ncbi:unnamed protein product, partial [Ectocarpus sp. 13 AM-2016]